MVLVEVSSPEQADARALLERLSETLATLTGSSGTASFDSGDVMVDRALFVVARDEVGTAVGCGAYRPLQAGVAELKRMYAAPGTRGVGAQILEFLERRASADGYEQLWLETRLVNDRAVRFYLRHGFARIENFGKYAGRPEAICFAKSLARQAL